LEPISSLTNLILHGLVNKLGPVIYIVVVFELCIVYVIFVHESPFFSHLALIKKSLPCK